MKSKIPIPLLLVMLLSSCMADLRSKAIKNGVQQSEQELYAKQLIQESIEAQGMNKASKYSTYEIQGADHWKGLLGKMGNVWDWKTEKMTLRFTTGDFDGQVEVLEGKKKGFIAGIQSWDYYEKSDQKFDSNVKDDKRIIFVLSAYHYFYELLPRLDKAPMITYLGKDVLNGKEVEKVFVSWGTENTKEYDQYVLLIGKESKLVEAVIYTIRDNYLPMSGFLYGSLVFNDYKDVEGVKIPFKQSVYLNNPGKNEKKYIHEFTIESFKWDTFSPSDIRPLSLEKTYGDSKPDIKD